LKYTVVVVLFVLFFLVPRASAQYSLPNTNSGCPSNCRQISWQDGSDLWNGGTLPIYGQVTCTPLNENGSTDDTTNVQNCINAANAGTGSYSTCHAAGGCAVFLPCGSIFISSEVRLKSNVAVRGCKPEGVVFGTTYLPAADATATTIICGSAGSDSCLGTQNFSNSSNIFPTTSFATFPSTYCKLSGTPTKGDTSEITDATNSASCATPTGTWIIVQANDDPTYIYNNGTEGAVPPGQHCDWCGNNIGFYTQTQIVQVTNATGGGAAGSTITLSRPLYYTYYPTAATVPGSQNSPGNQSEPSEVKYTVITSWPTQKAGYENLRIDASQHDLGANSIMLIRGCLYCWTKGLETYVTGSSSGSAHIEMDYTYGMEVRDRYDHDQRSGASGSGYGYYFQFPSSDAKVEDNICRHSRHCVVYQGGGSGTAILYNYFDDMYTDDTTYLGSARTSHGGHPFFNLFEGNVISHISADDFWGTSAHTVYFRNWLWGDETENFTFPGGCAVCAATGTPNNGFDAVELYTSQTYYAFVANVLGLSAIPTGSDNNGNVTSTAARHANWSNATVSATCTEGSNGNSNCDGAAPTAPIVYEYGSGSLGTTVAASSSTVIRNGNYDYKTLGVAFWDGGSTNNTFGTCGSVTTGNSCYYASKPPWFYNVRWPVAGPDLSPVYGMNPAEATYLGANLPSVQPAPASAIFALADQNYQPPLPGPVLFPQGGYFLAGCHFSMETGAVWCDAVGLPSAAPTSVSVKVQK
jgi:hypothetical protein